MRPSHDRLVLSSEHGSNAIPRRYAPLFRGAGDVLQTHRGWDIGTAEMSRHLARTLQAPLERARATRLLVDCNRSPHHRQLFSEFTRHLSVEVRESILEKYYYPYRNRIEALIAERLQRHRTVVHVSVHSFVPELNGRPRNADIGLLYDPRRKAELGFCLYWQKCLKEGDATLTVRRNYPYRGVGDGLVTHLRKVFSNDGYIGVELEFRQDRVEAGAPDWAGFKRLLATTLRRALREWME